MKEHAKRFDAEGAYKQIPLKQWVLIDFRHNSKRLQERTQAGGFGMFHMTATTVERPFV